MGPPAHRCRRRRPVRAPGRVHHGRLRASSPARSRRRRRAITRCRSTSTARPRARPTGASSPTSAGRLRGPRGVDGGRPKAQPDFGPSRPHPTAGAVVVGARRPSSSPATSSSRPSTSRSPGASRHGSANATAACPAVQALGIDLGLAGLYAALDEPPRPRDDAALARLGARRRARAAGGGVGLRTRSSSASLPALALTEVADHVGVPSDAALAERVSEAAGWLRIRDFAPGHGA